MEERERESKREWVKERWWNALSSKPFSTCTACLVAQSWLTLCDPTGCSLQNSSVHGISQARILVWVAISVSWGSSWPRDQILVCCTGRQILYHWATREAPYAWDWQITGPPVAGQAAVFPIKKTSSRLHTHAHTHSSGIDSELTYQSH